MPPVVYNNIPVILPPEAMVIYKEMEREFFIEINDQEASAKQSATAGMKCHQIANGRVYEDLPDDEGNPTKNRKQILVHSAKVEALANLIDELNGKPILIAYHYKHDLEALRSRLGNDTPHIGSGVSPKETDRLKKRWNRGEIPILLGHPCSMAHGLNMQDGGNDVCWFTLTWNLEHYIQFIARINRQGVIGQVRIHHLIAQGTIDIAMLGRLGERATEQQDLRTALRAYRRAA